MFSRSNKRIKKGYDGAKADIWACGVIHYVLLAGYLPFQGNTLMDVYKKICQAELK
jgi:5'-AMP-activated protein kinase, catalytic alpha subunit